jgi:hypothetical protein
MPAPATASRTGSSAVTEKRKRTKPPRVLKFEKVYLDQLPSAYMYERSYLHRDVSRFTVSNVCDDRRIFFIFGLRETPGLLHR